MERTSAQLEQRLLDAKKELESAIEDIDPPKMKKLRAEIKALPEQIALQTLAELKTRVEQIQDEIATENDSMELWRVVRVDAKQKLEENLGTDGHSQVRFRPAPSIKFRLLVRV